MSIAGPREELLVELRRARDHMDRHFSEPIDLQQLATVATFSKYHFHRLFAAVYGRTPATYLSERRIERAQDLLRATNLTVTEVCVAVGFSSLGSFSSRFRPIVGGDALRVPATVRRQRPQDPRLLRPHARARRTQDRKPGEAGRRLICLSGPHDHSCLPLQRLGS